MSEKDIAERRGDLIFFDPKYKDSESDLSRNLLSLEVSMGIDLATQVTAQVHDSQFRLAQNNYFVIGRDAFFRTSTVGDLSEIHGTNSVRLQDNLFMRLEIAAVTCSAGVGAQPVWTVELRNKAVQQMRRDKNPASIEGSAHDYVINAAQKYGLDVVAQPTDKTRKINKATSDRAADSVWDVLQNLASESKYVVFETENILFFGSQKWLLGRWGSKTSAWPFESVAYHLKPGDRYNYCLVSFPPKKDDTFRPVTMPDMRRSDNDPLEVQGSVELEREAGSALRPGMSVYIANYPTFEGLYLIDNVEYSHLGTAPVRVSFRSPEREEKDIRQLKVLDEYIDPYEGNSAFYARKF